MELVQENLQYLRWNKENFGRRFEEWQIEWKFSLMSCLVDFQIFTQPITMTNRMASDLLRAVAHIVQAFVLVVPTHDAAWFLW